MIVVLFIIFTISFKLLSFSEFYNMVTMAKKSKKSKSEVVVTPEEASSDIVSVSSEEEVKQRAKKKKKKHEVTDTVTEEYESPRKKMKKMKKKEEGVKEKIDECEGESTTVISNINKQKKQAGGSENSKVRMKVNNLH